MSAPTPAARRIPPAVWVLLVLLVGLAVGGVLVVLVPGSGGPPPPHAGPAPPVSHGAPILVSGLEIVLVLALVYVYVRTYAETRARFTLGLIAVLFALFFEALVSSPALFGALGYSPGDLGFFFLLGGIFEAIALTIFLYLSLE